MNRAPINYGCGTWNANAEDLQDYGAGDHSVMSDVVGDGEVYEEYGNWTQFDYQDTGDE